MKTKLIYVQIKVKSNLILYGSDRPRRIFFYLAKKKKKNQAWPKTAIDHHAHWHFTFQHGISYLEEDQTLEETLKRNYVM